MTGGDGNSTRRTNGQRGSQRTEAIDAPLVKWVGRRQVPTSPVRGTRPASASLLTTTRFMFHPTTKF